MQLTGTKGIQEKTGVGEKGDPLRIVLETEVSPN